MLILQIFTVLSPAVTARLVRSAAHPAATVILDLEDGLWDPLDAGRTEALKEAGRSHLVDLARDHAVGLAGVPLGVRINRVDGAQGRRDVEALAIAARRLAFDAVIVTKVEHGSSLSAIAQDLDDAGIGRSALVPIVETRAGMAELDGILDAAAGLGVRWLVYGYFDHALDMGWWPFPGPDDDRYWAQVEPVIAATEAAGIGHVHPPYPSLADDAGLARVAGRLSATCRLPYGMITIGARQTSTAAALTAGHPGPEARVGPDAPEGSAGGVHRPTHVAPLASSDPGPARAARHRCLHGVPSAGRELRHRPDQRRLHLAPRLPRGPRLSRREGRCLSALAPW